MSKKVLITWWLWFVWSHVTALFAKSWYNVIVADNISSSSLTNLADIEELVWKWIRFYECNLTEKQQIDDIFQEHSDINGIVHCAHIRPLWEKQEDAFLYYNNNVIGTINLLEMTYKYWIKSFVNTSTANLYNSKKIIPPYTENDECSIKNTYTTTNLVIEQMLDNISNRYWMSSASLRLTKVIGAHSSWVLGRRLTLMQNDIMNFLYAVASKKFQVFNIKWWWYNTKDWTFAWDYIHVDDVAKAYLQTYKYITNISDNYSATWEDVENNPRYSCHEVFNVWSWASTTVLQLIEIIEQVTWKTIPYTYKDKYYGDDISNLVITDKARKILNWSCEKTLYNAIHDWRKYVKKHF